jgi:hypothetical protein
MKKISAVLGIFAALSIAALPAFASTEAAITFNGSYYTGIPAHGYSSTGPWADGTPLYVYSAKPITSACWQGNGGSTSQPVVSDLGGGIYSFTFSNNPFFYLALNFSSCQNGTSIVGSDFGNLTLSDIESDVAPAVCSPSTITNGTIGSYPSCSISCDSGYAFSGGACQRSQTNQTYNLMGITLATGTAAMFLANALATAGDPGVLEVVALAVGIPLAFYILHQLIALVPKGKSGRRS